jgi:HEPN domain-containing protein
MAISPEEWIRQADYDIDTAEFMHKGGRQFYAVFMCHLSLEKGLKGLYWKKLNQIPAKSHHLPSLVTKIGLNPPDEMLDFITKLNEAQIFARYPDSIEKASGDFPPAVVEEILNNSREVLEWIKAEW